MAVMKIVGTLIIPIPYWSQKCRVPLRMNISCIVYSRTNYIFMIMVTFRQPYLPTSQMVAWDFFRHAMLEGNFLVERNWYSWRNQLETLLNTN